MRKRLLFLLIVTSMVSCENFYKAGNLIDLQYPVESKISTKILNRYLDSLILNEGFRIKSDWVVYEKLVDLDSVNNKIIYFKDNPEEMFLISTAGQLLISDVFNPKIRANDWVAQDKFMPSSEKTRIMNRFKTEILNRIEVMAKNDGVVDSVLYRND
jgi:hypothetical protein